MKLIPKWLSLPAFIVIAAVTAITLFPRVERLGFSAEEISGLVVESVVSGLVWGGIATWLVRRYIQR